MKPKRAITSRCASTYINGDVIARERIIFLMKLKPHTRAGAYSTKLKPHTRNGAHSVTQTLNENPNQSRVTYSAEMSISFLRLATPTM